MLKLRRHTFLETVALIGAAITLSFIGTACGESNDSQSSTVPANESPAESAAVKSETSVARGGESNTPTSNPGSLCGRFAESFNSRGSWEPSYYTPEGKRAGYDDNTGRVGGEFDLSIGCGLAGDDNQYVSVEASRVKDLASYAEVVRYRTTQAESGCHAINVDSRFSVGWACPPNDRSSDASAAALGAGWSYVVTASDWPQAPNDEELSAALTAWSEAIGDPTTYSLTDPSLRTITTLPPG
jgi:hypothetical protein